MRLARFGAIFTNERDLEGMERDLNGKLQNGTLSSRGSVDGLDPAGKTLIGSPIADGKDTSKVFEEHLSDLV